VYKKTGNNDIFISNTEDLTLSEYSSVLSHICKSLHVKPNSCSCKALIEAANMIISEGIVKLSVVFKKVFPQATYRSFNAKRRLLRIPLVAISIRKELYLMEKVTGFNYNSLVLFLKAHSNFSTVECGMQKSDLKALLSIVKGDREKECIRYAIYKCSNMTQTQAKKQFGLENMNARAAEVESSMKKAEEITTEIKELVNIQCQALYNYCGLSSVTDESVSTDDSDCDEFDLEEFDDSTLVLQENEAANPCEDFLMNMLVSSNYNWFEFIEQLEIQGHGFYSNDILSKFFLDLPNKVLCNKTLEIVIQSHRAFNALSNDTCTRMNERVVRSIDGEIVTDSESEPEIELLEMTEFIKRKQASIRRQGRRLRERILAERRFLSRKITKRTSKIISEFPNIGEVIEEYVKDHNVGADAWRRTGVLTFDGNAHLQNKVTYKGIQAHLETTFGRHFSYGTVIELCIPRNKRRRSAKRYHGLAKVTTRRARKGFNLRYNPDAHWSAALYKSLDKIQFEDGQNVLNINRDDAAGFRLDTLTTCKQHATPSIQGQSILTTRTDYLSKTPSLLQITSYNFTRTKTTAEVCVGIVKAAPLHWKNPAQHYSDLLMLVNEPSLRPVFLNKHSDLPKLIDFIRVDGSVDEGPVHEVVQYFWTDWHFSQKKVATLVTTRSSGSSYLNRVELQNGCLALGHANTFIPSTLGGSCVDFDTGNIDEEKVKRNLSLAIDAYISRVDGCPCGETKINLYGGSDSTNMQSICSNLGIFLKGSKKAKTNLQQQEPELFNRFKMIWGIRKRHMVLGLPTSYIFFLKCCFQGDCVHPICQKGGKCEDYYWYPGGPSISHLPFVTVDSNCPWGNESCSDHKDLCTGHYVSTLVDVDSLHSPLAMPPSYNLKEFFSRKDGEKITESDVTEMAKQNLLSTEEVNLWFKHLEAVRLSRKRGAAKAALSRERNKMVRLTNSTSV
jgi:hypothetical protein